MAKWNIKLLSEAIDTDQSVVLTVATVTIDTDQWKIGNENVHESFKQGRVLANFARISLRHEWIRY